MKHSHIFNINYSQILVVLVLLTAGFNPCFAQNNDDIIYDTVWVYDTVWEYETVYDTVWEYETVFDTVYIDENNDPYAMVEPITISNLQFSSHYYKSKTYQRNEQHEPKTKVKRSAISKIRYELKNNRDQMRDWNWDNGSDMNVTLNPTKGKFDPRIFKRGIYSIDVYAGAGFQNTKYAFKNPENNYVHNNDSINELPSLEFGMRLNFNVFQYGVQTGVGISQVRDDFNYIHETFSVDSTSDYYIERRWETEFDSVLVKNQDSIQAGSSYEYWYVYEKDVLYIDTMPVYDTTPIYNQKTVVNTISLVEIPLIFTYELAFSRFGMQLKLGGVNQIHTYSKGKLYNLNSNVVEINDHQNFTKYNFALYGGIGLKYKLTYDLSFVCDAYYKHPFIKFSDSNSEIVRRRSFGINAGLRYRF